MNTKAKGYTDQDLETASDNPEWTEETFKEAVPFSEMFPDAARKLRGRQNRINADLHILAKEIG